MRFASLVVLALVVACSDTPTLEEDAGADAAAGEDANVDAAADGDVDAQLPDAGGPGDAGDGSIEAGPTCMCAGVSTCCDGCHPRNLGSACDDGLVCSATSTCDEEGACSATSSTTCAVTWPACQARACSEPGGCGVATPIRNGMSCDDGNASTYADTCSAGACAGTPSACTVNNGGCTGSGVVCIGNDPAPPTCRCSSRYNVTATTVYDTTTGLTWRRAQAGTTHTFTTATAFCSGLAADGGGWRLPTVAELVGLHTGSSSAPFIDTCAFPSTSTDDFWTSSPWSQAGYHYAVDFGGCCGGAGAQDSSSLHVRCVR